MEIKEELPVEVIPVESTREYKNSKPEITISNVVCNYRCRTHLNLRDIALKTKHVIYKRFDYFYTKKKKFQKKIIETKERL